MKIPSGRLLIIVIISAVILLGGGLIFFQSRPPDVPMPPVEPPGEKMIQAMVQKAAPAMVQIAGVNGFFIRPDYLVTLYQTLPAGDNFSVTVQGKQYEAKFAGADPVTDLAILQIPGGAFPFLYFASLQFLQPGVKGIAAISGRAAEAVISGIRGDNLLLDTEVFTDATGCPLLNMQGDVLGIHAAPLKNAVLSGRVVKDITDELILNGFIERPMLGILASDSPEGITIRAVARRSPAAESLDPGDVILKINDQPVQSAVELRQIILAAGPGKEIFLEIRRKDRTISGGLILQKSPRNWFRNLTGNTGSSLIAL